MTTDKFQTLFDHAPFCVHEIAADGRLLSMNPTGLALVGAVEEAAVRGRNFLDFVSPVDRDRVRRLMQESLAGAARVFELGAFSSKLPQYYISCFIPCLDASGNVDRLLGISYDISHVLREGSDLRTLNLTYAVVSRCNRSLARSVDEPALLQSFCADLVDVGGYGFAWVGYCAGKLRGGLRMAAYAGAAEEALRRAVVAAANADGTCHVTVTQGRARTITDIASDPWLASWRASGRRNGYRSMVTLPLRTDQDCIGLIGILSTRPDTFGETELVLLAELAEDLAFGIQAARARAVQARQQCQFRDEVEFNARKRIAAVLHDEIGQSLQAVNLGLKRARAMSGTGEPLPEDLLNSLIEELGAALQGVREIGQELRPLFLERMPFVDALRAQCSDFATRTGIDIQCRAYGLDSEPDARVKYQCFLGFREALCNAIRHARASHIRVSVRARSPGILTIIIADNGTGFDMNASDGLSPGLGLCTLRERIELLGGSVSIRSRSCQGTGVRISVPLTGGVGP